MATVRYGDYVKVHYAGRLASGEVFDSTLEVEPAGFKLGGGTVLESFEKALLGMGAKEKRSFKLAPEDAYGRRDESLRHTFKRSELGPGFEPRIGSIVAVEMSDGQHMPGTILSFDAEKVEVDLNHPLAGHDLYYDVEVVEITEGGRKRVGDGP